MISRQCDECQVEYRAEPRYLNRGQGKFCSRHCAAQYSARHRKINHEPNASCSWCGVAFYRRPSQQRNSKSGLFFCCKKHQSLAFADPNHPVFSGPRPTGIVPRCKCGTKYSGKRGMCRTCYAEDLINRWLAGDISVTWCGRDREPQKWVKRYLIESRGDACEVCGFNELAPDGRSIIQMDHKDGNYLNNTPENLQLLCPNHHAMTSNYGSLNRQGGRAHRRKLPNSD